MISFLVATRPTLPGGNDGTAQETGAPDPEQVDELVKRFSDILVFS